MRLANFVSMLVVLIAASCSGAERRSPPSPAPLEPAPLAPALVMEPDVEPALRADVASPPLADEPLIDRLTIKECGNGDPGRWTAIGELIVATMRRTTALALDGIIWIGFTESEEWENDERAECAAMFASLPPRPATLVELIVPGVTLPDGWR